MKSMCRQAGRQAGRGHLRQQALHTAHVMPAYMKPTWAAPATCQQAPLPCTPLPSASLTTKLLVLNQPAHQSISDVGGLLTNRRQSNQAAAPLHPPGTQK